MEAKAAVSADLTECRTRSVPSGLYNTIAYQAVASGSGDDIYRVLGIDEKEFAIYAETQRRNDFRGFLQRENDEPFEFRRGMELFLYVLKLGQSHEMRHVPVKGTLALSVPAQLRAERLEFRSSREHFDNFTATLTLSAPGAKEPVHVSCRPNVAEAAFSLTFEEHGTRSMGIEIEAKLPDDLYRQYEGDKIGLTLETLSALRSNMRKGANIRQLLLKLKDRPGLAGKDVLPTQGIKSSVDRVLPFYEELLKRNELHLVATFQTLAFESKRTINSVKVSRFINDFFGDVADLEGFRAKLQEIYGVFADMEDGRERWYRFKFEDFFAKLPGYADLRKSAIRSQSGRALTKMVQDIDAIQFDREKCPILAELITDGSIPVSTFFRKEGDEAYFLFNDNWELFEEFLGKHKDVGVRLAQLASQRTTYEKSFMSYLYFVLYELPEYLAKHTGKAWTCLPSIVASAEELEPGRTLPGQTLKKRSALTPIVGNEACTVTVPYACLKVPGISTTYTYSLTYSIVRRGLSIDGDACTRDIEERLNGRDDYGLMFYTLTGSAVGRGYPTFLIIFERLDSGETRVHFHRTHPMRSKDGDKNPVNNWIRSSYNWMAGNVRLGRIRVQQGDLVFVSVDEMPAGEPTLVDSYDSHAFSRPVEFIPCAKKDPGNVLGHFRIAEEVTLDHPEHRMRVVPTGTYELRQCRSWEANPKGVWSLRID